jgi:hypothetical protein
MNFGLVFELIWIFEVWTWFKRISRNGKWIKSEIVAMGPNRPTAWWPTGCAILDRPRTSLQAWPATSWAQRRPRPSCLQRQQIAALSASDTGVSVRVAMATETSRPVPARSFSLCQRWGVVWRPRRGCGGGGRLILRATEQKTSPRWSATEEHWQRREV